MRVTVKDTAGVPVDSWSDYYPFGKISRSLESVNASSERLTGKVHDAETNLEYFGARYYNADIARWISVDPLFEKHPDWTPYNYVLSNPLRLIDPDGKQVEAAAAVGYAIGIVAAVGVAYFAKELTQVLVDNMPQIVTVPYGGTLGETVDLARSVDKEIKNLEKGISSLGKQIEEHEKKLDDYQKDPEKHDNKDQLKNAPSPQVAEKIKQSRVEKLKNEINKFKNEQQKKQDQIDQLKKKQNSQNQGSGNNSKTREEQ